MNERMSAFLILLGILGLSCMFGLFHYVGVQSGKYQIQSKWDREKLEQSEATRSGESESDAVSHEIDKSHQATQIEIRTVYKTIEKEVVRYVQSHSDSCSIDADWLRIHDTSASGISSGTTASSTDAGS